MERYSLGFTPFTRLQFSFFYDKLIYTNEYLLISFPCSGNNQDNSANIRPELKVFYDPNVLEYLGILFKQGVLKNFLKIF